MSKVFGFKDSEFKLFEKVPHTKQEVRAVIVHKLSLEESSILWDIGAGTGTITIECANLMKKGIVYAIEKEKIAYDLLVRNIDKFGLSNVIPIYGEAPDIFENSKNLKEPTHVFIGGTGKRAKEIFEYFKHCHSVKKIVMTAVTFETLTEVFNLFSKEDYQEIFELEITQISISSLKSISNYSFLTANNPIFLFDISRKSKKYEKSE